MVRVTRHVAARLAREGAPDAGRRVLSFVPTHEGVSHHVDAAGETWRLVPWVEGTRATERASTEAEARETARAFGRFLAHLQDLPGPPLHETILAFHDTPGRLVAFERAVAADRVSRASGCRREIDALLDRRPLASALAEPAARGEIPVRPTHNDAKIANVLFDATTGEGLCVVDLDTVMPGLAPYDFGDLARSTVSDSDEDERDLVARPRPRPRLRGARPRLRRGGRRRALPRRARAPRHRRGGHRLRAGRPLPRRPPRRRPLLPDHPPRPQPRPRAEPDPAPRVARGGGPGAGPDRRPRFVTRPPR